MAPARGAIDFQVNESDAGNQTQPAVAADGAGNFVVVWGNGEIMARRYDATGTPLGGEFQVNGFTTGSQDAPAVAADGTGNFVVAWVSNGQFAPTFTQIFGQRFDTAGVALGGEFQVNAGTMDVQLDPDVATDPAGSFVVVWKDAGYGVRGRRFDSAGTPLGGDFQVDLTPGTATYAPRVGAGTDGGFLVVWSSKPGVAPTQRRVLGRRFDAAGAGIGEEFHLALREQAFETSPALAAGADADYLVAWQSRAKGALDSSISGRHLTPGRILGSSCTLIAGASARRVICQALEKGSLSFILGDPVASGATLRIVANGGTPSDQTFVLPPGAAWHAAAGGTGFFYNDSDGMFGPVRAILVKRSRRGVFRLRVIVAGTNGAPPPGVQTIPPDPGTDVTVALAIGAEQFCTGFGTGHGGGVIRRNDATAFKIRAPATERPCP